MDSDGVSIHSEGNDEGCSQCEGDRRVYVWGVSSCNLTSITSLVLAQVRARARARVSTRARVVSSCNLY